MRPQVLVSTAVMLAICALVADLVSPAPAWAYLDPGTGSLVFQWIIGGIVAVAFTVKMFRHRALAIFRRGRNDDSESDG